MNATARLTTAGFAGQNLCTSAELTHAGASQVTRGSIQNRVCTPAIQFVREVSWMAFTRWYTGSCASA